MNTVSVRTPYIKAIVSRDSRHALARLQFPRRLDTRYANTTNSIFEILLFKTTSKKESFKRLKISLKNNALLKHFEATPVAKAF